MGWFSNIQNVEVTGGGNPLPDGTYPKLQVDKILYHDGNGGSFYIAEGRVVESLNPDVNPGHSWSWVCKLNSKYPESAVADVKRFVASLLGLDPQDKDSVNREVTEPVVEHTMSPMNPMAGRLVSCKVVTSPQRQDPTKDFTKWFWGPAASQDGKLPPVMDASAPQGYGAPSTPQGPQGYGQPYGAPSTPQGPPQGGAAPYIPQAGPQGPQGYGAPSTPQGYGAPSTPQGPPQGYAPPQGGGSPQAAPGALPQGYGQPAPQAAPPSPQAAPQAPAPAAFPPPGWQAHPTSPGWWWDGKPNGRVLNEAQLRAAMAAGQA